MVVSGWFCGRRWPGVGLLVLSVVGRVEAWSGLRAVGTVVGDWPDAGAGSLCLCFHRTCPLFVKSSHQVGVGFRYVDCGFVG